MAFTGNFMATSFKKQLLEGVHDFRASGGDTFKLALYTNSASFTAATTQFTATNEVGDSGSYVSGGGDLTNVDPAQSGTTAFVDFADISFTAATTAFTTTDEVPDSGTYVSGGGDLTRVDPTSTGTTAFTDFQDISFTSATINARGAMIYNSTPAHTFTNPTVAILDFGEDKVSTTGTFTVQFPTPDASNAIIRLA